MVIAFLPLVCWVQGMAFKYFPEIMIHVKKTTMSMIYFCMLNTKKKSVISRRLWCSPENNNSQDICKISNITWKLLHQLSLQNLKLWEKDSINWSQQTAWFAASLDDSISLPPYWYREINNIFEKKSHHFYPNKSKTFWLWVRAGFARSWEIVCLCFSSWNQGRRVYDRRGHCRYGVSRRTRRQK